MALTIVTGKAREVVDEEVPELLRFLDANPDNITIRMLVVENALKRAFEAGAAEQTQHGHNTE